VTTAPITRRLADLHWDALARSLWDEGFAKTPAVLSAEECDALVALYGDDTRFRSRVDMARYRFGEGDYKYLARPLPPLVESLRAETYPRLATLANAWEETLGSRTRYPADLAGLLGVCRRHGQTKPTPLLLHYEAGGYNCLHQDLYGDVAFPLQITAFLSRRGVDYEGGDFLLVEQRPRAQSRGEAIHTEQGELVIFPTRHRAGRARVVPHDHASRGEHDHAGDAVHSGHHLPRCEVTRVASGEMSERG
jgi:uncharacterized protein